MGWKGYVAPPRSQLTLWIYIVIVAVLVGFLINSMQREAIKMEALAVKATLNQIRMQLLVVQSKARINQTSIQTPLNPFGFFEETPMDYRGEFDRDPDLPGEGYWFYQRKTGELVYRPQQIETLDDHGAAIDGEFRFRVNPYLVIERSDFIPK